MKKFVIITQAIGKRSGGASTLLLNMAKALDAGVITPLTDFKKKKYKSEEGLKQDFEMHDQHIFFDLNDEKEADRIADVINQNYDCAIIYPGTLKSKDVATDSVWSRFINFKITISKLMGILSNTDDRVYKKDLEYYYRNNDVIGYFTARTKIKEFYLNKKSHMINDLPFLVIPNCIDTSNLDINNINFDEKIDDKIVSMSRFGSSKKPQEVIKTFNYLLNYGFKDLEINGWDVTKDSGSITFVALIKNNPEIFSMWSYKVFDLLSKKNYQKHEIPEIYRNASYLLDCTFFKDDLCLKDEGGLQYIDIEAIMNGVIPIMNEKFCDFDEDILFKCDFLEKDETQFYKNIDGLIDKIKFTKKLARIKMISDGIEFIKKFHSYDRLREILENV